MNQILVVDDDPHIRELVCTLFKNEGFSTCTAADGREALALLASFRADLCILDLMMPRMDGYEFCRQMRPYYSFPILMLTAKGEIAEKVRGFELGADDYLVKPFEPAELIVRAKALMRRYQISCSSTVRAGKVCIDCSRYTISMSGVNLDIPRKEFDLLFILASYPGRTLTRDRLIEEIWGYDFEGNERTLDVHINRLRDRFPPERTGFKITTIRGLGYRLEEF